MTTNSPVPSSMVGRSSRGSSTVSASIDIVALVSEGRRTGVPHAEQKLASSAIVSPQWLQNIISPRPTRGVGPLQG